MIFATNGARLYIGGDIADPGVDLTEATFNTITWTEIGEVENLGTVGDVSAEIPIDIIGRSRTVRLKGTRNAGTLEVVCGIDYSDPGQIALLAAEQEIHDFAFRIVLNDAPAGGTPSERLFIAKVGSAAEAFDTANSVMRLNASLWVNSNVVRINAAV